MKPAKFRFSLASLTVLVFLLASLPLSGCQRHSSTESPRNASPDSRLPEGWKQSYPIRVSELGEGHSYHVWVEEGWLHVSRKTSSGESDWHVVLARVVDTKPPVITAGNGSSAYSVSYRDGRYFIREDTNNLLCVRERKVDEAGTWSRSQFLT